MRPLSDFLERFRTALVPPGPSTGRVMAPVDVASRLRGELAPLFGAIDEVEGEASVLVEAGEATAERLIANAERLAAVAVMAAEDGASEARLRAGATRTREFDGEIDAVWAASRGEADRIREASEAAVAALVARVVSCVESQAWGSR